MGRGIGTLVRCTLLGMLLGFGVAGARAASLLDLQDVRGDDDGAGVLIYPNRDDLQPGDLDLVRFTAEPGEGGVWFAVEMQQPVRDPRGKVTELGQTPMDRIARNGFYTFNVDVYIDTDRVAGSGQADSVPGRGVTVDRNYAWEKCIVLTPRPDIARTMLQLYFDGELEAEQRARQGKVSEAEIRDIEARSEQWVAERYFFASRVRVAGRRIEFFVPAEFLGGTPQPSWAYTVLVTGADLEPSGRPGALGPNRPSMMTMSVGRGVRWSQFGIRGEVDSGTPPVVDLLAPDPATQAAVLQDYDVVAGRLAAVPGLAADGREALAASGAPASREQSLRVGGVVAPSGGTAPGAGAVAERRTVPARLRALNQLLEEGLITQEEFAELRRKILSEL